MNTKFIIPQKYGSCVAQIKNDDICVEEYLPISYNSKSIFTENGLLVVLAFDEKELRIYDKTFTYQLIFEEATYLCLNTKENIIYLGGIYNSSGEGLDYIEGELFSILDLNDFNFEKYVQVNKSNFEVNPFKKLFIKTHTSKLYDLQKNELYAEIEIPIKKVKGKAIDDILILNNELILVDNIVFPKYIFYYDISKPKKPKHIKTLKLANNGTYENIIKGDINKNYLVLFSSTVGMGGGSKYLNIIKGELEKVDKLYWKVYSSSELLKSSSIDWQKQSYTEIGELIDKEKNTNKTEYLQDFTLIDNYLILLTTHQLGYLNLNEKIKLENMILLKKPYPFSKLIKTPCNQIIAYNETEYEWIEYK